MKLTVTVIASLSLIAGCKKEEPKKTPEQAAAEALKALGAGSGSAAAGDLAALGAAIAGAVGSAAPTPTPTPAAGSAAAGGGDLAGALGALGSMLGGAGSGSGGGGALGDIMGAVGKLAGAATLTPENQAIVDGYNAAMSEMTPLLLANAGDCVKLGTALAPVATKHAGALAKMKDLKADESQKMGLGLAMATGPTLAFVPAMMAASAKCKDSAEFKAVWDKIKDVAN